MSLLSYGAQIRSTPLRVAVLVVAFAWMMPSFCWLYISHGWLPAVGTIFTMFMVGAAGFLIDDDDDV